MKIKRWNCSRSFAEVVGIELNGVYYEKFYGWKYRYQYNGEYFKTLKDLKIALGV